MEVNVVCRNSTPIKIVDKYGCQYEFYVWWRLGQCWRDFTINATNYSSYFDNKSNWPRTSIELWRWEGKTFYMLIWVFSYLKLSLISCNHWKWTPKKHWQWLGELQSQCIDFIFLFLSLSLLFAFAVLVHWEHLHLYIFPLRVHEHSKCVDVALEQHFTFRTQKFWDNL